MMFLFTQVSYNKNSWDFRISNMGGDYSQLCGHFPAVTMDRVPSRGAVVFSIPSHQAWAQSGGCRRQLLLSSAFNDLHL